MKTLCSNILVLSLFFFGSIVCASPDSDSEACYESIKAFIQNGQHVRAKAAAEQWVALSEVDEALMSDACSQLSNHKAHGAAVVLLERLNWIMPLQCSWPDETLYYMKKQGLDEQVDAVLTYGTALVAGTDAREPPLPQFGYYVTLVNPNAARRLFYFWKRYEGMVDPLYARYESEMKNRPDDVGLLSEYAYWLSRYNETEKAVEIAERINLAKLDLLSLSRLGTMWDSGGDTNLVRFSVAPLEEALTREMTDCEARLYTTGWQALVMMPRAKRLFQERLLTELAGRYAYIGRYEDAKKRYEEYLALPRREHWGDRTRYQREYAEVIEKIGRHDPYRVELEDKAKQSGNGADWAELAAYLQGQGEVTLAGEAWMTAIELTPAAPRRGKVERTKERYRQQLIKMLDDHRMYEEELVILKEAYEDETNAYSKKKLMISIAKIYLMLKRKDEAMVFLYDQLRLDFKMETVEVIFRTDHEETLFDFISLDHRDLEHLSSWGIVQHKIRELPEPQKSEIMAEFYHMYSMYAEYVDLVEQLPMDQIDCRTMIRLRDFSHRCGRYGRAVFWGKKLLEHIGEEEYPGEASREHINALEDICQYAAQSGDYETSLEYAKKLCLMVPERFYFARALAKLSVAEGKRDELLDEINALVNEHPYRWVVWKVLSEIYEALGMAPERDECFRKIGELK